MSKKSGKSKNNRGSSAENQTPSSSNDSATGKQTLSEKINKGEIEKEALLASQSVLLLLNAKLALDIDPHPRTCQNFLGMAQSALETYSGKRLDRKYRGGFSDNFRCHIFFTFNESFAHLIILEIFGIHRGLGQRAKMECSGRNQALREGVENALTRIDRHGPHQRDRKSF